MKIVYSELKIKEKFDSNLKTFKLFANSLKQEGIETKEIFDILHHSYKNNEKISEENLQKITNQLKDIGKLSILIPLIILPASPITIPILYKIANKYNIDLTASSFKRDLNEVQDDIDFIQK